MRHHHHHHRHHHSGVYVTTPGRARTPRGDWMHSVPPWRMPRTHADGIGGLIMLLFLGEIFAALWMLEVELLLCAWFYYAAFLGARAIYRSNAVGQTLAALTGRKTKVPAYDPHGAPRQPVDLATLGDVTDPWDTGNMRRRG